MVINTVDSALGKPMEAAALMTDVKPIKMVPTGFKHSEVALDRNTGIELLLLW